MIPKTRAACCSGGDDLSMTRREFLGQAGRGIGSVAIASMLGSSNYRLTTTGIFLAALLGFVLLHRTARQEGAAGWLGGNARGVGSVLASGAFVAVGAITLGLLVGPVLPGADDEPLIAWRDLDDGGG